MNKVKQYLDLAAKLYYEGTPIITDEVFDRLAHTIGYYEIGSRQHADTEQHYVPMYSLQKYYVDEGAEPLAEYSDKVPSLKLDGAAVSLLYAGGKLVRGLTRGDGIEGKNITDKLLSCHIVPHDINHNYVVQITGEIVAPSHIENARNYAAGSLNLKDIEEFKTRAISFFAYGISPIDLNTTFTQDMQFLASLGFSTVLELELDKVYPCDGMVFRVDSNELFDKLGFTAKHPRGAYALKERKEAVETTLVGVEWQVGKSGKVTPVGILKPVKIGDAWVARATLNNPGFIEMLDLQIGDTVGVVRAGEIIPCITHKVEG